MLQMEDLLKLDDLCQMRTMCSSNLLKKIVLIKNSFQNDINETTYDTLFVKIEFFIKRGGTQEVDPQISSWFFVSEGFRPRWLRIWRLKLDLTTCSACSGRSAYGSSRKIYFRYSAWEKFKFGIKMLGETSWARFWSDLVEITSNKEVMMNIVEHMKNVILIFRFF